ncbi:hypothetical protein [Endozoicomonas sp. ONNA2]|nr:hypothetical protein [Endozoicomonas sp. ONNA2]
MAARPATPSGLHKALTVEQNKDKQTIKKLVERELKRKDKT